MKTRLTNVTETCSKIRPDSQANSTAGGDIAFHMERARNVNREILELSSFIASEVISLVIEIENNQFINNFENADPMFMADLVARENSGDLSYFAPYIFDYLLIVDRLDDYRHEFLPTTSTRPSYLVAGSNRDSDDVPLPTPAARCGVCTADWFRRSC